MLFGLERTAVMWYNRGTDHSQGGAFMALENKLGITDSAELARAEERISKQKAAELGVCGL